MPRKKKRKRSKQKEVSTKKEAELFNPAFRGLTLVKKEEKKVAQEPDRPETPGDRRDRDEARDFIEAMSDVERDITKQLLDRGLVPFLITREDRELFAKKQEEEDELVERVEEEDIPRLDGPQGEVPVNQNGEELELDQGDYGDHQARTGEGEEYQIPVFNDDYDAEQY